MAERKEMNLVAYLHDEIEKLRIALRNRTKTLRETRDELDNLKYEIGVLKAKYEQENIDLPFGRLG